MILRSQTNFVEFLEQVLEVLKGVEIDKTECSTLLASVQKQQLVIPVVGNFSAGKSTLLNRFLEKGVLPTGIKTSLATELHYSANERIEAFSNNDEKTESFELNERSFEVIKDNATKYSYLKVYLNNEALKNSAPLVFVDMPGFDSPISSHTHAKYLERGVHFVILVSVEEGRLTKYMVRGLKTLLEFDKGLSFILSKTNLRTPSQVEEISRYIQEQIQDHLDLTTHLIHSNKDNNTLLEVADKIDAEKLFSTLYLKRLKFLNSKLQNSLKSVIESFDYSKEKALEEIQALDLGVKDIEKTYEKLRANLEEEYSSVAVGSVVKKVVEEVREQKSYLASLINKPNEFNSEIESIMQQSLIKNTKLEIEKINLSFSKDFCTEFASLNNTQFSSDLSVNLEHSLELGINALSLFLSKSPVTRPFALILQGLKPLLNDLMFLSSNIIGLFYWDGGIGRAELENLIEVKVIPEVQHKLKKVLPGLFNECLENSLKSLKDRCELEITHKKQEIALAQKEKRKTPKRFRKSKTNLRKQDQRFKRSRTTIFKGLIMNAQELIQKSALIEKTLQEQGLQERAKPFMSDNAVIKTEELEKTLKEMQAKDRDLKVGIIGRVKAGKSSLLNALIFEGVEVLPKAATPMTASLTVLKYAQNLSAEVEFYSPKDIAELKNEHERYVREFNRIVDEEVKKQKEKQSLSNRAKEGIKNLGNKLNRNKNPEAVPKERVLSDEEIVKKAERIAKSELEKDTKLVSSYDQYEKMKKSGLLNTKNLDPCIQANSLQELNQKLLQFVGANGKFMPCTKAVQISLNNPNLKDLEVIDTPGVNDPIASREEHTKALLKDCDVVFIVSPSNQFLTDSDMSLFDRVSNKEGLQEIYFVASQADSAVLSMSEVEKSNHHLPTAFENAQKALSSQLNNIMEKLIENYPNQREVFEKAIKNGVILASGVCFSMYKDFSNQASWERNQKTEEYHNALRSLRDAYPDAFNSDDKSKESLLFLSNMGAIEERLEKAAKEKEKIMSQKLQDYAQSQANNLHSLIAQLLQDLEEEKKRIKNADMGVIKKQVEAYENLSGNIEMKFREVYEEFILHFINNIRVGLEETLKKAIQTAKTRSREEEEEERYTERVKQGGAWGSFKRNFLFWADDDAGYDEVERTRATIKAGAVLDYLTEMHERCESALNDSANSFKVVFKKELYAKVFSQLREIISDDLIDEVAFKKSVDAVLNPIEFKEFDYTDKLPSEIMGKTGNLKGDEANAFIQSVGNYVRNFEAETKKDVKGYIQGLRETLERQNFASDTLQKLQKDMQNLHNQVQNKEQSIAQLDAQIKALMGIQ